MKSILKSLILTLLAGILWWTSCQAACAPFPQELLPPPQVVQVEIPERTLVFSDRSLTSLGSNECGCEDSVKLIEPEEWYAQARQADDSIVPIMIIDRMWGNIDLFILKKDGGEDGSSTRQSSYNFVPEGLEHWNRSLRWNIRTESVSIDRTNETITFIGVGERGMLGDLYGFVAFVAFVIMAVGITKMIERLIHAFNKMVVARH